MNERIKELADQAKQYCFEQSQKRLSPEDYMPYSDMYDKKFAELIVWECSQYIEDKFDFCGDEIIIAEKLLEHFGVDGMSTEDKKTLIKELLGVKNETNQ